MRVPLKERVRPMTADSFSEGASDRESFSAFAGCGALQAKDKRSPGPARRTRFSIDERLESVSHFG